MPRQTRAVRAAGLALALLGAGLFGPPARAAAGPRLVFLDAREAAAALSAEEADGYFNRLQALEMSAKTGRGITGEGLAAQRAECRRRYIEATLDFTGEEIATLVRVVTRIHAHLQRNYPRVVEPGWSFLKLDSHIEGGLPHTVGKHIVLSPRLLAPFAGGRIGERDERLWNLQAWLLREQLHVVQRRHPRLFERLYTGVWGFRRLDALDPHPWLVEHQVLSPDVQESVWIYPVQTADGPKWIWPTVVLGESRGVRRLLGVPSLVQDVRMVAVAIDRTERSFALRVDAGGMPVVRRLLSFQEYRSEFPFSMAPYHPDRIAAEGFAQMVIRELMEKTKEGEPPAAAESVDPRTEELRIWFATHLD